MSAPELRRMKGEFLASLNHEIRTPLSGIVGMTDLLLETRLDDRQKEFVKAARLCAEELLQDLNAALEFSALAAGELELEESDFNLPEVLAGVVEQYQPPAQAKDVRLFASLDPGLPAVAAGDAVRLREIVWHLVGNAVKFTRHGEVELKASAGPASESRFWLAVTVRDTGIGLTTQQRATLFDPLSPGDSGLARRYPGLGLGLALSSALARRMGGEIGVESEPGRGTVASFRLPLRAAGEAAPKAAAGCARGRHVLLVEDYAVSEFVISRVLRNAGCDVESAATGEEALAAATRGRFDLVLMDLQMPGMDGFATARALRALPGYAGVPIVALTAHTEEQYRAAADAAGMQGFLTKPVDSEELLAMVERLG